MTITKKFAFPPTGPALSGNVNSEFDDLILQLNTAIDALTAAVALLATTISREDYTTGTASGTYSGSTTVFDLAHTFVIGDNSLFVFVDGVLQRVGASNDYMETDTNTVTFNNALISGQVVTFYFQLPVSSTDYATKALDNLGSVAINTTLLPGVDNSIDLGSSAKKWASLYIGTNLFLPNGTVGAPALAFTNDPDSGLYRIGTDNLGIATAGVKAIDISAAGEITRPLQPSFLVTDGGGNTNVTGDGTVATITWGTEIFDQGADFSSTTFTAPVTGRYLLSIYVELLDITGSSVHTVVEGDFVTSNRVLSYWRYQTIPTGITRMGFSGSVIADMDAADTVTTRIKVSGSSKVIDVGNSSFSGSLIN